MAGESDVPGAEDFAAFIRERIEQVVLPKSPGAGPYPALAELLGSDPAHVVANESLLVVIEQRLQDRQALERQKFDPVIITIVERVIAELSSFAPTSLAR